MPYALWVMLDLVEAAVRTDRHAEAAAHVAAMRDEEIAALSPRLALLVGAAAAVAAPDHAASELFDEAPAVPGVERWPFDLARVQLAHGERLRRARSTLEARKHFTAAFGTFQQLGVSPWATRAANELRAAGQSRSTRDDAGPTELTLQKQQIADLAAEGMTNKQIAERLFLSHRTVGAHLYRISRNSVSPRERHYATR